MSKLPFPSLKQEEATREKWKNENIRRRHNYVPLIVEMLRAAADQGKLMPLYQAAQANEKK